MDILPRFVIEDDDLDLMWRFTAYMELVVRHARIDYLRRQSFRNREIALEHLPEEDVGAYELPLPAMVDGNEFDFEEARLGTAFSRLNLLRQRILTLIFVEGLSAREVADKLNFSVDYVYLQKHRALKALRDWLMEGGDWRGE
jgi:RNA polymerase sigma factor (sigma-70 family)